MDRDIFNRPIEPSEPPKAPIVKVPKPIGRVLAEKVKSLIFWIGLICSIISAVAYILIVVIMAVGFDRETTLESNIAFALITAFVGILISQFLKWQGISFAKNEDAVKEVWEAYYGRKTTKRKYRSLTYFWIKSVAFDVAFKAVSVAIVTIGTVYIFIEASGDTMRILMALFNLTLFAGFGMMSLTKAYDFTKEQHTAWMLRQMEIEAEDKAAPKASDEPITENDDPG